MASLTIERRAELTVYLTDARRSYHLLMTGQQAKVFVDQNGERVEYNSATALQLQKYIAELERQLGEVTSCGPLNVWM